MIQIFEIKTFTHILKTATWPAEYFTTVRMSRRGELSPFFPDVGQFFRTLTLQNKHIQIRCLCRTDVTSPTTTATMADKLLNWVSGQTRHNINDKNKF